MLNNRQLRALFLKVMGISFFITLVIAAPYISRRAPEILRSLTTDEGTGDRDRVNTSGPVSAISDNELDRLMDTRKASGKQVKPSFDSLPVEFFSANQPFALDFHKLPVDFLVPQAPEVTRAAAARIRELREAEERAAKEPAGTTAEPSPEPELPPRHGFPGTGNGGG